MKVTIKYGTLVGKDCEGYALFAGIPYAAPPVGELRWKAPQPPAAWEGERDATVFGNRAWQLCTLADPNEEPPVAPKDGANINYGKEFYAVPEFMPEMNEDCLYLNVWTPAKSADEKLPVALWIHGGAFLNGFGSELEFDGAAFAKRGVILVSINYRLGMFGYLCHPELAAENDGKCGNYGLLDQIEALKWVRENIAAFGGDPEKITIFGQSAGAMSVQSVVCSPLAKGLFAGAIMQSGGGYKGGFASYDPMEKNLAVGEVLAEVNGCKNIAELRAVPAETLMANFGKFGMAASKVKMGLPFGPVIDGYVLPESYDDYLGKGNHPDVPYMLGYCTDDLMVDRAKYGAVNWSLQSEVLGRAPGYVYEFARRLPGDESGAFHSAELWYIFGTLSRCWRPLTEADYALGEKICDYWCNFVKTGAPGGEWKPCSWEARHIEKLDVE